MTPEAAPRVVAPPYDALTPEQRRELAASEPDSFLNALPATDPDTPDPQLDTTLADCRTTVERLLLDGHYEPVDRPFLAVLRAAGPGHVQTGVVADLDLTAVDGDRVRPHEQVRDQRVAQLTRYLEVVGVASSPVCVGHRPSPAVAAAVASVTAAAPTVVAPPGLAADDATTQSLWVVDEPATVARLGAALATIDRLYLTDGHHRTAAARRHADAARVGADHRAGRLLVALFPTDELRILGFHRLVATGPVDLDALAAGLAERGWTVRDAEDAPVVLRHAGRRLAATPPALRDPADGSALVEALPVRWFERDVLGWLGIAPDDERVAPVAAARGTAALDASDQLGVQLAAPDLTTFVAAADGGVTLPAKSTYFWPKARSGMLLVPRHA